MRGLNKWGDLVGNYVDSLGTHGFAWLAAGQFWSFDIVGATATYAQSINDARQIAGYYQTGSSTQAFVAMPKPIPLPATLPLLAAGLVTFLRVRRVAPSHAGLRTAPRIIRCIGTKGTG